jgi:class 3 adenylate cyclase/tetratricopeptide (TPR) repeat protein
MTTRAQTVTILFTDLVGSTELLQRAGDEQAQRIFKAHHRLLREAVEAHAGHEVKWLGDGLMVAFDSAADAVKCAIAMQQSSRRPTAGERLEIRAGLNVGEAFVDESDFFGTSVVIARRLCDSGGAGDIRASDIVVRLLDGSGGGIQTKDLGALELKGITDPVPAVEIVYQHDPMALLRKLPFVGRDAEYEAMLKRLADARNGRGGVILLAGEPGIGKTRLTEEFCEHASGSATVVRGNCYEGDVAAPFGPWVEALRSLLSQTPDGELRQTLGPGGADIAVILPDIKRRLPDLEDAPKLEPEAERARLFESIGSFLRNAAETKPLVIFLDDLHWCDRPSLALLEQVARGCADKRIVIVGTYRDVEVDRVHPLAQTLAALRRMEHHERILVRGFTQESVYDLLHAIEPSEQAEAAKRGLAAVLYTESEGNPFFIREVLSNLIETGKLAQRDGVWTGTVASIEELGIPEGIKEVIGRRLSRMSETCNRMLGRASAMTSGFTWDELRAICDGTEDDLLDALDEALAAQLIEDRGKLSYAFTHALVRATLYEELSAPRRVQLHRRIGEALETLYADSIDDHLGELAAHYMASTGNAAGKAVEYSIRAGDRARELFAWEEAAGHYQRAVEAMALADSAGTEAHCKMMLSLAGCLRALGQAVESASAAGEAARIARALGSRDLLPRAALAFDEAAYQVEDSAARSRLSPEVVALLDEALTVVAAGDRATRALLLCFRAREMHAQQQAGVVGFLANSGTWDPGSIADLKSALDLVTDSDDNDAMVRVYVQALRALGTPDDLDERHKLACTAAQAALRSGSDRLRSLAFFTLSAVELGRGDIAALRRLADEWAAIAERTRDHQIYAGAAAVPIMLDTAEGRLASAERRRSQFSAASADAALIAGAQLAHLRRIQGRLPELEPLWRGLVERFPDVPVYASTLALMLAEGDDTPEARGLIDELVADDLRKVPRDGFWKATMNLLADACAEAQQHSAALAIYDALLPYVPSNPNVVFAVTYGSMARVVGRLATMLERYDEAEQHFETALASNDRMGFHAWTTWTRLNYGEMLIRRNGPGDRERAATLLRQAHDFAKESGMAKVERDSERLLAGLETPA